MFSLLVVGLAAAALLVWALWAEARARQLAEALKAAEAEPLELLNQASGSLVHSLDLQETLDRVGALLVPRFGDGCTIDLFDDDGLLTRVTAIMPNVGDAARAASLRPRPLPIPPGSPIAQALESRSPLFIDHTPDEVLRRGAMNEEHYQFLKSLRLGSTLFLPLIVHQRPIGILSLGNVEARRTYSEDEIALVNAIVARGALAIENARLFQQAEEAIRVRDDFLTVASHELKTPLTSLQLQAQLLLRPLQRDPTSTQLTVQTSNLRAIERSVGRLASLVNSLLDVSRIVAKRVELDLQPVEIGTVVRDVLGSLRDQVERSGSRLSVHGEEGVVGAWDRSRLEQILTNLVTNALKYGLGKPVSIEWSTLGDRLRLTVEDHGIGIAAEDQARLFKRFERIVPAREFGGFGLGLWITRQFVEAHGGRVEVESRFGEGSRFTVELPRHFVDSERHYAASPA